MVPPVMWAPEAEAVHRKYWILYNLNGLYVLLPLTFTRSPPPPASVHPCPVLSYRGTSACLLQIYLLNPEWVEKQVMLEKLKLGFRKKTLEHQNQKCLVVAAFVKSTGPRGFNLSPLKG